MIMQNREFSWLSFNERVLEEAGNKDLPLFERLKFLEIFTSNLDEFFMIRVASNLNLYNIDNSAIDNKTGMMINDVINGICLKTNELNYKKDLIYNNLIGDFKKENINILEYEDIKDGIKDKVKKIFKDNFLALLSPQIIDYSHPFPLLENKAEYLFLKLDMKNIYAILYIPKTIPGYLIVDDNVIFMSDVILLCANMIFKKYKILDKTIIKITRNADIELQDMIDDEFIDYRDTMKRLVKKRKVLKPIRLECYKNCPDSIKDILLEKLELPKKYMFISKTPLSLKFIYSLISEYRGKYLYPKLQTKKEEFVDSSKSIISQVLKKDILLSYPYESMDSFLKLIKEAAWDKNVVSIKITIYRLSNHSKLIDYLLQALDNKKEVTAVIELRARFDEDNNINYSEVLEEAGCRIIYGFEKYKIHSKLCLITRKVNDKISYITQVGTGNYNEKTACLYTDYSYITSNYSIGVDASSFFFNIMLGNISKDYNKLLVSPASLKCKVLEKMNEEIQKKEDGYIFFKVNSLTDADIINKFHEASRAGCKVYLIIRGICCILPGIKGETDNIVVKSVVGRFLEHSRIYLFGKNYESLYISSADMMTRNTERRIEVACPIESKTCKDEILRQIDLMIKDDYNSSYLDSNGEYSKKNEGILNVHEELFKSNKIEEKQVKKVSIKTDIVRTRQGIIEVKPEINVDGLSLKFDYKINNNYLMVINTYKEKISLRLIEKIFYLTHSLKKLDGNLVIICNFSCSDDLKDVFNRNNIEYYDINNYLDFINKHKTK